MISTAPDTCQAQRPTDVIKVKRHCYIHVLDNNTNVTRTLVGPLVYTRLEHESSLFEPQSCIWVPAQSYCEVKNPVIHKDDGSGPVLEPSGQASLRMGDSEIRLHGPPFPLYPGEELVSRGGQTVFSLDVIAPNEGYHVRCLRDFVDEKKKKISAGTEWMEAGPKTYIPRVEVTLVKKVHAEIIKPHTALRLSARSNFTDRSGTARVAGEHWCVRTPGAYLPFVEENIVGMIDGFVLSNRWALHLMALQNYTDVYNTKRLAGEMWLVSSTDASVHIVDVHEKVMKKVEAISLSSQQYCIILNPVGADGKNMYGEELVRRGECTFFLRPGEKAPGGVQEVEVVGKDEALLLKARSSFTDNGVTRPPGSTWMLHGPTEYVPDSHVTLVERRKVIALDKNEGIYVMNTRTGVVRAVIGEPYMPTEDEVLWEKHLPPEVEELLASPGGSQKISQRDSNFQSVRDRSRIVRFNVQHNAAVQIYDYRKKTPRIVFGPDLVILAPHEEFTVLSLSGGKPKVPNALQSLQLFLGPRFSSDTIIVETSDHARLQLRLSYNWHFDVDRKGSKQKSFAVPDFIGDCCKTIASRVRGAVASEDFDSFHRNSAKIIRSAVFGVDADGEARKELRFQANDFVVTNVDVQFAEPTDEKTRDSLQKSVQLAIEITTKSLEAAARHGNELKDQVAKGQLECQRLLDKIAVEKAKTQWLELQAKSEAVQASGQSVAEARAKAEALLIEVTSELRQAELRSKAYQISAQSELKKLQQRQSIELEYTTRQNEMEVEKARRLAESEAEKVKRTLDAIGRETIVAIAQAGPELQAKLLSGLGLKGYLITDGNSPVNLFHTAQGMVGSGGAPPQ